MSAPPAITRIDPAVGQNIIVYWTQAAADLPNITSFIVTTPLDDGISSRSYTINGPFTVAEQQFLTTAGALIGGGVTVTAVTSSGQAVSSPVTYKTNGSLFASPIIAQLPIIVQPGRGVCPSLIVTWSQPSAAPAPSLLLSQFYAIAANDTPAFTSSRSVANYIVHAALDTSIGLSGLDSSVYNSYNVSITANYVDSNGSLAYVLVTPYTLFQILPPQSPPSPPTNLSIIQPYNFAPFPGHTPPPTQVQITWTASPSANITNYIILYSNGYTAASLNIPTSAGQVANNNAPYQPEGGYGVRGITIVNNQFASVLTTSFVTNGITFTYSDSGITLREIEGEISITDATNAAADDPDGTVLIPYGVVNIADGFMQNNTGSGFKSLFFPTSATTMGTNVLSGSSVQQLSAVSVASVGASSLSRMSALVSVDLESLQAIGSSVLSSNAALASISTDKLVSVGVSSLSDNGALKTLTINAAAQLSQNVGSNNAELDTIILKLIKSISTRAAGAVFGAGDFSNNPALTTFTFPPNVSSIAAGVLSGNAALTSITFTGPYPSFVDPGFYAGLSSSVVFNVPAEYLAAYMAAIPNNFNVVVSGANSFPSGSGPSFVASSPIIVYTGEFVSALQQNLSSTTKYVSWLPGGVAPKGTLFRGTGRKTYVYSANSLVEYVFVSVQRVNGPTSEGVGGQINDVDSYNSGWVCIWSADGVAPSF